MFIDMLPPTLTNAFRQAETIDDLIFLIPSSTDKMWHSLALEQASKARIGLENNDLPTFCRKVNEIAAINPDGYAFLSSVIKIHVGDKKP